MSKMTDLSSVSVEDIFAKLREILPQMEESPGIEQASYLESAAGICRNHTDGDKLGRLLVSLNFVEIFQKYWRRDFDDVLPDDCDKLKWHFCDYLLSVMWNMSDQSDTVCERILESNLHCDIFHFLKSDGLHPRLMTDQKPSFIGRGLIGILHNVVQRASGAREAFRACDAVEILQPFRECSNQMISSGALMVQSYLVTEAENEKINSNDDVFEYLIKHLDASLKGEGHMGVTLSPIELLKVLNRLASNDENKCRIVKNGALPYYIDLLSSRWTAREKTEAAHGLWILAFKCKESILAEPGCIEALKALLEDPDERLKKEAEGAIWILEGQNKPTPEEETARNAASKRKHDGHVFISYQWDAKPTVLMIRDRLKAAGIRVWVDEDDMSSNVLDGMATAVEKASAVIVCLSQKYKDSPNCRTEAEYTFRLKKKIVPLRLQPKYYPDGWLGLMTGSKLVLDFSEKSKVEAKINELVKEVVAKVSEKNVDETDSVRQVSIPVNNAVNDPIHEEKTSPVKQWTKEDVAEWVKKNNLDSVNEWFSAFNGSLLLEYNAMRKEAPEAFFAYFMKNSIPLADALAISQALKEL